MNYQDKKILYVDDNTAQRKALETEIEKICHPLTPVMASSMQAARELLKEDAFEAVVSDFKSIFF